MGWLEFFRSKRASTITVRDLAAARAFPLEYPGRGARRQDAGVCKSCGGALEEVLITTGGEEGDPDVWRAYPLAVDGWRCNRCGGIMAPRFIEPSESVALGEEGTAAVKAGAFDKAELAFRRMVSSWSEYRAGRHDLAQALLARVRAEQMGEARAFFELRLLDEIEAHLDRALTFQPPPPRIRVVELLAQAYLARDQPQRARALLANERTGPEATPEVLGTIDELERYVELRGDLYEFGTEAINPSARWHGMAPRVLAEAEARRVRRGIEALTRHAEVNPTSWQALFFTAKGFQALDEHDEAQAMFGKALAANSKSADVCREYCAELMNCGRHTEAVEVARQACLVDPSNPGLVANLSIAILLSGDVSAAREEAKRAISMDSSDPINRAVLKVILDCAAGTREVPRTLDELEGRSR